MSVNSTPLPANDMLSALNPQEPPLEKRLASEGRMDLDPLHFSETASGSNLLVTAANPVLNLVPHIRGMAELEDAGQLRQFLIEQIQEFERRARDLGVAPETVIGGRYCLCTLLDETAAQTPWGGSGLWSRHSLLVTFHNETWGGEKFFQLLSKLAQNPKQYRDLLSLMYYCISLGLEGRFRIIDNGRAQ